MARLSLSYICAYLLTILTIADSIYYLISVSRSPNELSSNSGAVFGTMSTRILVSLVFLVTTIFLDTKAKILVSIETIAFLGTAAILVGSSTFLLFHTFVPSLILQILTLFASGLILVSEIFTFYHLHDKDTKRNLKVTRILRLLNQNMMALTTLLSVASAILVGILIRGNDPSWTARQLMYLGFPGDLFLRLLKCLILPLIFSSLIYAIGSIDAQLSGKIALRAITYYMATTAVAIIIGIVLVTAIEPGRRGQVEDLGTVAVVPGKKITTIDTILDLVRNMFPSNIFEACFAYYSTSLNCNETEVVDCDDLDLDLWTISSVMEGGSANILGIVVFAIIFGVMISRIERREVMVAFFRCFNDIMMQMTSMVITITPLAVTFLILPQIIKVPDLSVLFGAIGYYTLCVVGGQALQGFFVLPVLYFAITRKSPLTLFKHLVPAMITAFGTSSSSATMPVTITCLEDDGGPRLDQRIVRFCIPIGSTINMDGTALYEAVAAIFIAQYREVELDFVKIVIIAITATAASIGAAGIPQGGLVTIIIVLNAVGLPAEDAALIVVIDWFIDRFRTMLNVLGDAVGCAIVDHLSRGELDRVDAAAGGGGEGEDGNVNKI